MEPLGLGDWNFYTFLIAFAGGIVGASLGGLFAFIVCGLIVFVGVLLVMAGGPDFVLLYIGLGPVFGPHVGGFAAAIGALAYAVGVKKVEGLDGKNILAPLMDKGWDVLLVGGIFGILGHVMVNIWAMIPVINMFDIIALTVMVSALLARFIFHKEPPWGKMESIKEHGYLGYPCQWIDWMNTPSRQIIIGFGVGIFGGWMAQRVSVVLVPLVEAGVIHPTAGFLAPLIIVWAIAAISLVMIQFGGPGNVQKIPVWHCMAILGGLCYMLFGSILLAGVAGIAGIFIQDFFARMFWNHGSNHIDPPAMGIAFGWFFLQVIHLAVG